VLGIGHFFVGYSIVALLSCPLAVLAGLWALAPDLYKVVRLGGLIERFHNSWLSNACFGHHLLDKWDKQDKPKWAAIPTGIGAVMSVVILLI